MEVYFFSFTGNCRKIATWIAEHFEVETYEIVAPNLPYFIWLILSFIPYLEIKCKVRPPMEDKIILCFPKWSLNCPPITYFLNNFAEEREIYMIICYGGFDERRYAEFYRKFALKRAKKSEYMLVRRRCIEEDAERVKKNIFEWIETI